MAYAIQLIDGVEKSPILEFHNDEGEWKKHVDFYFYGLRNAIERKVVNDVSPLGRWEPPIVMVDLIYQLMKRFDDAYVFNDRIQMSVRLYSTEEECHEAVTVIDLRNFK